MNYRKVYMRIVLNAKKEMSLGIRPKNDFQRRKNFEKYGSLILGEDGKFHKDPNCKSFGGKGKKRPSAGAKISKAIKGSHIYNNGIINKRAFECPEGFVPGKLKK